MVIKDFRGVEVDHAITFEEFMNRYLRNSKDFREYTFTFYEAGARGCGDVPAGFKTHRDWQLYDAWRKSGKH